MLSKKLHEAHRLWETVTQLVKKVTPFMEPGSSLPCLQEIATGSYPEPDESNPFHPKQFLLHPY
jgi:hypothetical protein